MRWMEEVEQLWEGMRRVLAFFLWEVGEKRAYGRASSNAERRAAIRMQLHLICGVSFHSMSNQARLRHQRRRLSRRPYRKTTTSRVLKIYHRPIRYTLYTANLLCVAYTIYLHLPHLFLHVVYPYWILHHCHQVLETIHSHTVKVQYRAIMFLSWLLISLSCIDLSSTPHALHRLYTAYKCAKRILSSVAQKSTSSSQASSSTPLRVPEVLSAVLLIALFAKYTVFSETAFSISLHLPS
jgi:hypothetical protein